jgi:hypothetical protein
MEAAFMVKKKVGGRCLRYIVDELMLEYMLFTFQAPAFPEARLHSVCLFRDDTKDSQRDQSR